MAKQIYIPKYDSAGNVTWYTYDVSGNLVVTTAPNNQDVNTNPSTLIFEYSVDGICYNRVVTECLDCTDGLWDTEACYNLAGELVTCPDFTDTSSYEEGCMCETCTSTGSSGFDFTGVPRICTKVNFDIPNNAFNAVCPDNWTTQDMIDMLNAGNPNGAVFGLDSGNSEIIVVLSGTAPTSIWLVSYSPPLEVAMSDGGTLVKAKRVKDCNSDRQTELLQEIADNTCPSTVTSNVVCNSTTVTVNLVGGGTTNLTAGQELLLGEVYDCNGNLQRFSLSVLIAGVLEEIQDAVATGTCPSTPETIPTGCVKDANGQEWDSFQTILNGNTVTYYQDSITGVVGTPSGAPSTWSECGSDTTISIPTISVFDADSYLSGGLQGQDTSQPSYSVDIDALPVAFPDDYVPPVYIQNKTQVNYNQGNGNTGQAEVGTKVWFPESAVIPVEFNIPTTTVTNWNENSSYSTDIDALPIAFPEGYFPPVHIQGEEATYYIGNGTYRGPNAGNYGINGGSDGASVTKVWFPESAVLPTEMTLPTISIIDFDGNDVSNQDENMTDLLGGGYTKDIEALPVGVIAGDYLPVKLGLNEQEYHTGGGNTSSTTALRVAFPESAVINTQDTVLPEQLTFISATTNGNFTIPAGSLSSRIVIKSGIVNINGAEYDSCTPFEASSVSHGSSRLTYPAINIVPNLGASFTYSYTTI